VKCAEHKNFGVNWYDYGARFYDPALGRFTTVDPLSEDYFLFSPYGYCAGNPVACRDENGEWINFVIGAAIGAATDYAVQVVTNVVENGGVITTDAFTNVDYGSIGLSAGAGAVGVGIASGFQKLATVGKLGALASESATAAKVINGTSNVIGDATSSVAGSMVQNNDVTVKGVVTDIAGGAVGRKVSSSITNKAQSTQKVLDNQANRAQRVASGTSKQSRVNAATTATSKAASNESKTIIKAEVAGGVGSNATAKVAGAIATKKEDKP
jgi:RHS repeat-associated protein